jgi:hypothetical protein
MNGIKTNMEGILILVAALAICTYCFIYPKNFIGLIQFMYRISQRIPPMGFFWAGKDENSYSARPIFVRLLFLPVIIVMPWALFLLTTGK